MPILCPTAMTLQQEGGAVAAILSCADLGLSRVRMPKGGEPNPVRLKGLCTRLSWRMQVDTQILLAGAGQASRLPSAAIGLVHDLDRV